MTDLLLPTPASINSQECDCKWVKRPMGPHRSGPHQEYPAGDHTYHDEEDTLVHHDLQ